MNNNFFLKYGVSNEPSKAPRPARHPIEAYSDDFDDEFDDEFDDDLNDSPCDLTDSVSNAGFEDDFSAPIVTAQPSHECHDSLTKRRADATPDKAVQASAARPLKRSGVILSVVLFIEIVFGMFAFSSSERVVQNKSLMASKNACEDFNAGITNLSSDALSEIYSLPKVYVLPFTNDPAPKPNPGCYGVVTDSDIKTWNNTDVVYYSDETIKVTAWREKIDGAVYNFADITIAHPSQLRRAFAGGEFSSKTRHFPQTMAQNANAVLAVTGDFYNYRTYGVVVYLGKLYRNEPRDKMPDVLFVNSDGDLIIQSCPANFDVEEFLSQNDIMFSASFGPALVKDGHVLTANEALNYEGEGWIYGFAPRTAIGQLGRLHYLVCTVDGKNPGATGTRSYLLAQAMADKGCSIAYNLDGGHTSTLIFGGDIFNRVAFGGQRASSDIIYFATALPEETWQQ